MISIIDLEFSANFGGFQHELLRKRKGNYVHLIAKSCITSVFPKLTDTSAFVTTRTPCAKREIAQVLPDFGIKTRSVIWIFSDFLGHFGFSRRVFVML